MSSVPTNTRLYEVLELTPTATHVDIKRAYHRLAIIYHPDKAGPAGAPKFREINAAYSTLSDPNRRAVYDAYGERGLQYASGTGPLGDAALSMGSSTKAIIAFLIFIAFIFASMMIIFLSFIAAKIDGVVHWSWPQVMSPLFVMNGILLLGLLAMTPKAVSDLRGDLNNHNSGEVPPGETDIEVGGSQRKVQLVLAYVVSVSFIALTITVAAGLDDDRTTSKCWRLYLIPWYIWSGAYAIGMWAQVYFGNIQHVSARLGVEPPRGFTALHGALEMLQGPCSVVFAVVCACRIDAVITVNWFVVAAPLFVAMLCALLKQIMEAHLVYSSDLGRDSGTAAFVCTVSLQIVFGGGLPLATLVMVLSMLEGSGLKMAHALIPIYLVVGCTVLASCCMCCGTAIAPAEMFSQPSGDERPDNGQQADSGEANGGSSPHQTRDTDEAEMPRIHHQVEIQLVARPGEPAA